VKKRTWIMNNATYRKNSSVYRLLKANDLIASSAYIVIKATDELKDKTTAPNQLWRRCGPTMSPIHSSWHWWPQAATAPRSCTNHDCSAITDRAAQRGDLDCDG
jgi:hypothetical protein